MNRKITLILGVLLFAFVSVIYPTLFDVKSAEAYNFVAVGQGHLASGYDPYEYQWEDMVTGCIIDDFFSSEGWGYLNAYWDLTTEPNVEYALSWMQDPFNYVDGATTWWVGEFISDDYSGTQHYGLNGYGNQHVWDRNVYSSVTSYTNSKQYFNFIWTCVNGGYYWDTLSGGQTPIEGIDYPKQPLPGLPPVNYHQYYGYHDSIHITGAVGMPYAWTGRTNMGNDYCYIGFETTSPYLQDSPPGSWTITDYAYGYFPYYFYEYLLGRDGSVVHHDIADSLDYAARETFGTKQGEYYTYEDSILNIGHWFYTNLEGMEGWWYWRMRVIGYEDGVLP